MSGRPLAETTDAQGRSASPRDRLAHNEAFVSWLKGFRKQSRALYRLLGRVETEWAGQQSNEELVKLLSSYYKICTEAAFATSQSMVAVVRGQPGDEGVQRLIRQAEHLQLDATSPQISLDYPAADLKIYARTRAELGRWRACEKEPWTVAWIESAMRDGGTFYDIGANVGAYALIAASVAGERGHVYAFEPAYSTYAGLIDNVALNHMEGRITAFPFALSDILALVPMHYRSATSGAALHRVGDAPVPGMKETQTLLSYPVLCYPLDSVVESFGLQPATHMKIDVDGHELNLLKGAIKTLSRRELRTVMIECSGDETRSAVTELLTATCGLVLDRESTSYPEAGADRISYLLFERR